LRDALASANVALNLLLNTMIDLQRAIDHFRAQGRAVLVTRERGAITAIESFDTHAAALDEQNFRLLHPGEATAVFAANPSAVADTSIERRRALLDNPEE
jgi:uncharacterized protein (DUF1501 family)